MGNIAWTKSWSASDNGTVLGGADLQNIQNDITTVVNGGITNTNINASAAIVESKIAFNTTSGHTHNGTDSRLLAASNTHFIKGCELVYASAATFTVNPGILELNGSVYSRVASSTTMNLATASHWVYGSEPANGWVYVYAYNNSGTSWDVKLSTQAPAYYDCDTDDVTGTLRYRDYESVWYRCIGAVRNSSSNILQFYQKDDIAWYLDEQSFTCGTDATFTEVDLTGVVPAIADEALLMAGHAQASAYSWWRNPYSSTDSTQNAINHILADDRYLIGWMLVTGGSTYSKAIDYKESEVALTATGYVAAWRMNVR